jgi:hypothetical protein
VKDFIRHTSLNTGNHISEVPHKEANQDTVDENEYI